MGPTTRLKGVCEVALPWTEEEFFSKAVATPHPMEGEPVLPDHTKKKIFDILTLG